MNELNELFTTAGITGLLALTLMEIMLGIDNVIFVSIILGKLKTEEEKKKASTIWMLVGMVMRIALLYILGSLLNGEKELFSIFNHPVSLKDFIMVGGGLFLLVNTTLEIHNKLEGEDPNESIDQKKNGISLAAIVRQIVLVDFIFSVDGIITSVGMSKLQVVRYAAVIISMIVMFLFARKISKFINAHPTFKMLALSFLILIAFTLIVDGVHVDSFEIPHGYVYFAMAFSLGVELLNLQLRKKTKKPVTLRTPSIDSKKDENL
ncbi:MAG: TerC family protein [Bacteroidetes bacterium]|nr:TerC family protein [Bacteroidota bacterium]